MVAAPGVRLGLRQPRVLRLYDATPLFLQGTALNYIVIENALPAEHLRANGSAGCNRYFGQVELQGSQLRIKQMASTMMLCPAPQQDWERAMTSTLSDWSEVTLGEQQLLLKGPQHELQFKLQDWVR